MLFNHTPQWANVKGFENEIVIHRLLISDSDYMGFVLREWMTEDEIARINQASGNTKYPDWKYIEVGLKNSDIVSFNEALVLRIDESPMDWNVPNYNVEYKVWVNGILILPSYRISTFYIPPEPQYDWVNIYRHGTPLLSHDILRVSSPYKERDYFVRRDWFTPQEQHRYNIKKDTEKLDIGPWFVRVTNPVYDWSGILHEFGFEVSNNPFDGLWNK